MATVLDVTTRDSVLVHHIFRRFSEFSTFLTFNEPKTNIPVLYIDLPHFLNSPKWVYTNWIWLHKNQIKFNSINNVAIIWYPFRGFRQSAGDRNFSIFGDFGKTWLYQVLNLSEILIAISRWFHRANVLRQFSSGLYVSGTWQKLASSEFCR